MASILTANPELTDDESATPAPYREAPCNVEAEQSLLGALLVNNEALQHIGDQLRAEHFLEPLHQRIFEAIHKFHDKGLIANPITLKHYFDQDQALADIGGGAYLAKLASAAITVINIHDYGQLIYDLALKRQLIEIGEDVVNAAYEHKIDIPALNQIENAEQKLFHLSIEGTGDRGFRAIRHSVVDAIKHAEHAYKHNGVVGLTTGLIEMDKLLGGLQRSDLLILAGRPSMGKTALATNIAYNACMALAKDAQEKGSAPRKRAASGFSRSKCRPNSFRRVCFPPPANSIRLKFPTARSSEDFAHLVRTSNEMASLPFFIDDTPALSISGLRTRARRLKRMHNLKLLIVDYLQLVRGSTSLAQNNRVQEVSEITQGLKAIAKELDLPVVALSQLSRAVEQREDKKPLLSDLRESGSIEQDADVVMFIYREEYYLSRTMPSMDDGNKFSQNGRPT